ncbi:DNA internalization-related competence protein ComEC/Rec2 [Halomonas garicola]|uniref:DNA internalization-related competence protein ComEC/Rec2 n=1 Tax=Halomonas garicola TaxID=1690008 RepID=UPI002897E3E9|nr:DNA internalization-related competence protein ComEC/Rec2 [Halomonas garicola]
MAAKKRGLKSVKCRRAGLAWPLAAAALGGAGMGASGAAGHYPLLAAVVPGAALLLAGLVGRRRPLWPVLLAVWLLTWSGVLQERASRLPAGLSGADLSVSARVTETSDSAGIPRLLLSVERCQSPPGLPRCDELGKVRVSVYGEAPMRRGERWQMTLRLRPPHGFRNPGAFDYQAWLWREGIHATGYVRQTPAPVRTDAAAPSLKPRALAFIDRHAGDAATRRWLAALTLGESGRLTQDDWNLLNASGTTHLVVISGLHVGLVAGFGLWLSRAGARRLTPLSWRLRLWPWWVAAGCALAYALLAGLTPPATRALIMALVGLWALAGRHAPGAWQAWWLAMAIIAMADPLAVWRPGFWLSFVAVAWLIVIWQGRRRPEGWRGWLRALCRSQLLLAPAMAGAVLLAFGRVAPLAPLINLLAVPWVSMIMVPLALFGWLAAPIPYASQAIWWLFGLALDLLRGLLEFAVAAAPLWEPEAGQITAMAAALGLAALCWGLPAVPRTLRALSLLLVPLAVMTAAPPALPEGALRVRVYDVGQGQLIELRTRHSRTLYDTGPRFRSGFMPLEGLWPPGQRFDRVIVSHRDTDHAGGIRALQAEHRVARWLAPAGDAVVAGQQPCRGGQRWQRDGVAFAHLWPPAEAQGELSPNDGSCVLQAAAGEHRLLITGDVGARVERRLLSVVDAPVSVLIAGHHGSATSSGVQFVRATAPRHAVFSAGRDNRFGHPVDTVVRRFRRQASCLWNTAHDGALTFWLIPGEAIRVKTERDVPQGGRC